MVLEKLEPSVVWGIFENIFCRTYRPSGHEEKVAEKIIEWVENLNKTAQKKITIQKDRVGNILLAVPPTNGCEYYPVLLLQGHLDMVTETERVGGFEFSTHNIPIRFSSDGKWVEAEGTTLGADNGVGCSIALALIAEPSLAHGPLEILFTVSEETGLDGAFGLDPSIFHFDARYMVNLDSEELGVITIGSAGGGDVILKKTFSPKKQAKPLQPFKLHVGGLQGAHSGVEIHEPRGNAIQIAIRILSEVEQIGIPVLLGAINGGSKHNAIPRECEIVFAVDPLQAEYCIDRIKGITKRIHSYYSQVKPNGQPMEPNLCIEINEIEYAHLINHDDSISIFSFLNALPHGVLKMSAVIPDLVESSVNFAIIRTLQNSVEIILSFRSNIDEELIWHRQRLKGLATLSHWACELKAPYPGWAPDPTQPFTDYVKDIYKETIKKEIKLAAIHAGLECGIIGMKIPDLQTVAIGPTILQPHTPNERVEIESVHRLYQIVKNIIQNLSKLEMNQPI
jgi:dipeptidase D